MKTIIRYFLVTYVGEIPVKSHKYQFKLNDTILRKGLIEQKGIVEGNFLISITSFLNRSIIEKELKKEGLINIVISNIYEFKNKKEYNTWDEKVL